MYFVYLIRSGNQRGAPIKIGHARDVESRIEMLQTGNPSKLHLIAAIPVSSKNEALNLEKWLHGRFSRQRIRGEWFKGNIKLAKLTDYVEYAKADISWNEVKDHHRGKNISDKWPLSEK